MENTAEEQEIETTSSTEETDEEEAFEASYAGDDVTPSESSMDEAEAAAGDETTEEEPEAEESTATETTDAEGELESEAQAEPTFISQDAFDKFQADNRKALDKLFGHMGDLKHKVEQARTNAQNISPNAKKRLQEEFPEFADILFDADSPAPDLEQTTQAAPQGEAAEVETIEQKFERKLLKRDHKDYEEVFVDPAFADWTTTALTAEQNAELFGSWDAELISERITQFKAARATTAKPKEKKPTSRVKAGVQPKGVHRNTAISSEEDEEDAAMVEAFGKR